MKRDKLNSKTYYYESKNIYKLFKMYILMKLNISKFFEVLRKTLTVASLLLACAALNAQITVTGAITDDTGGALSGVGVTLKGTTIRAASNSQGTYSISAPADGILIFSYVGFTAQEIAINNRTQINLTMLIDAEGLDEVVVVGYGTQKKAHMTGSVAAVSGEQLRALPTSNLRNALAGRLSGVTVSQTQGGRPGNASDITVRARGTWNSTAPLFVIDGVVRDSRAFDVLDASEVENVSVLKDASAASIYGSRAANGVILVTTKRGKEGKPVVSYSGSIGFGSFTLLPERESAMQHIAFTNNYEREYNVNANAGSPAPLDPQSGYHYWPTVYRPDGSSINGNAFTDDEVAYYRDNNINYDLMDEAWQTPVTHNHSVNVSGGNERVKYFAGITYYTQTGAFKVLNYDKYTVRGSIDAKIAKGLSLSASINTDQSIDKGPTPSESWGEFNGGSGGSGQDNDSGGRKLGALYYNFMRASHLFPGKVDGKYIGAGDNMTNASVLAIADGAAGWAQDRYNNTEYTASLQYDLPWVKGLNVKVMYNKYIRQRFEKHNSQTYLIYQLKREGANNHIITNEILSSREQNGKPSLYESHTNSDSYQLNGFINYNNTFGKHAVGAMLGFEQAESNGEWFNASKWEYELQNHPYFNYGPSDKNFFSIDGRGWEDARLSYIGRFNYAFDSRYLLEFSFRRDASVKFAPDRRWGFFPAGSAAWRVSEESFFKNSAIRNVVNNLKLRGSAGLTGNDAVGSWQYMDLASVNTGGAYYGGNSASYGTSIGRVSNPFITWEKSFNWDLGLETGFLNNMFTIGFDYFFRHTYDILGSQTAEIPDTFGATLADSNYGIVDSWGYELELGFNKQIGKDVSVWAKGNFGFADNKLVEWAETGVPPHLSKLGKNWDRQYGYIADGVIQKTSNNGNGTYTVHTSNGNTYVVPERGYLYRGSNYDFVSTNKYAMRPGSVFIKDIGSSTADADGNKIYNSELDNKVTDDDADKTWIVNHYNPPYNFGLLLGGSWKGLSLEVFFQGLAGHQTQLYTSNAAQYGWAQSNWGFWSNDHFSFLNNPTGTMPAPTNMGGHNMQGSESFTSTSNHSMWIRNASFIRLKNVTIAYDFNKKLLSKANISLARIYVTGNNLALLYNPLKEYDPELAATTNDPNPGGRKSTGIYSYPPMRTITVGINFSF
jgi:TonB-linked SusC/RagA family outer membrane protein